MNKRNSVTLLCSAAVITSLALSSRSAEAAPNRAPAPGSSEMRKERIKKRQEAIKLKRSGNRTRKWGIGLVITGLALGVVGGGLAIGGYLAGRGYDCEGEWLCIPPGTIAMAAGALAIGGGILFAVIGGIVSAVGNSRRANADKLLEKYQSDIQPRDPNHERRMATTLRMGQPRAQVFAWRLQF